MPNIAKTNEIDSMQEQDCCNDGIPNVANSISLS